MTSLPSSKRPALSGSSSSSSSDEEDEDGNITLQPVETQFCDWCCKYFANSLMKQPTECDTASSSYQQREYRFIRNHVVREEATKLCPQQARLKLSDQVFVNRESKPPQVIKFHPYQPHMAVMHKNSWSIWDIEQGTNLVKQHNCTYSTAKITAAEFVNPHDISFLLVGSEDGAVHIWRDYCPEESEKPRLVTAWRALLDMLPASKRVGMVLEWEQMTGLLYASGDVRHIRVWDVHKELMMQDIPTKADSSVTCLTSDSAERSLLIAGCGDGTVRLYDRRQHPNSSLVQTLREHQGWIVNVHMQQHSQERSIVSCSVGGDVRIWDPRFTKSVRTFNMPPNMNVCDIHPQAPLLACASPQQAIRIYNIEREEMLNHIRYHDGFMGQRIGPTKCLAFHPNKVLLAAGGTDGLIAIYSMERKKIKAPP